MRDLAGLTRNVGLAYAGLSFGIGQLLKRAGNFEQTEIAFETLINNAEVSRDLLQDLFEFAKRTPFQLVGLFDATKRLLAFGIEADNIITTLTALGNIAAGVGREKLPNLILAFGQVRTAARLRGQEARQFTEAGVPIIEAVAKQMNVAQEGVQDLIRQGKVSFEIVNAAIQNLANGTGRFTDLMIKQSKTLLGLWSNFIDAVEIFSISVGKAFLPQAKQIVRQMINFLKVNEEIIKQKTVTAVRAIVKWLENMTKIAKALWQVMKAVVNTLGGFENTLKLATLALGSLIAVRVLEFFGNLSLVILSATRNLFKFIAVSRAVGVAMLSFKAIALAIPLAIGAAFVALFLIIEDIVAFFQGRDSLIGGLISDFDKNAPAFFATLDKFEEKVLTKVRDFVQKVVAFLTSEEFATVRAKLAEAIITAFDVAVASSAAFARIGFKIGEAIFNGIVELFAVKAPTLARFLGIKSEAAKSAEAKMTGRAQDITTAQSAIKRFGLEEASKQFPPDIIAKAQERQRRLTVTPGELAGRRVSGGLTKAAADSEITLAELIGNSAVPQDILRIRGQLPEATPLRPGGSMARARGLTPFSQTVNNNVNINGSQLDEEQLKSAVGSALDESNAKLFRETERSLRPAVSE
jgi:tape measure domain-containing protein